MFQSAALTKSFVFGGNATFTVVSNATEKRYTFKVRKGKAPSNLFFVSVMYGPDNNNDFVYIGMIKNDNFIPSNKRVPLSDIRTQAFGWIIKRIVNEVEDNRATIYHENRCGRCARKLTTPESILTGFGPECITRIKCE